MSSYPRRKGRPPGSRAETRLEAQIRKDNQVLAAVNEYRSGVPLRVAADRHAVAKSTVFDHQRGLRARREAHGSQMALTEAEEDELVEWLRKLNGWGIRFSHAVIKRRAEGIRRARGNNTLLGANWVGQSLLHRHPEMKTALGQVKDNSRSAAENDPVTIDGFYNNVRLYAFNPAPC